MDMINQVMVICGWIITLGGAGAVLYKLFSGAQKPKKEMDSRMDAMEKDVKTITEKLDRDYAAICGQQESINLLTRSMFGLVENKITGNNIDGLKEIRDELVEEMTSKKK